MARYVYDKLDNRLSRKTRAGDTIAVGYNTLNRLTSKTPSSGPAVTSSYTYDALNRPTGTTWDPAPAATAPAAGPGTLVTFNHSYNKVNQRVGQTVDDNTWLSYPTATPATTAYTANALNQYTAVGPVTPTYDGNGNLTSDGTNTLGYDLENRLVSASGNSNTAAYAFDAQGRRKSRTVNGTTTISITDTDNREVMEYDGSTGAPLRWYAYGLGANAVLGEMNVSASTRTMPIPSMLGSIIGSLDAASGTITKSSYLPYGDSASPATPFGFTGQRIDLETGLYYYRARAYSTVYGRFLQPDPIGYAGGVLLYGYVENDPLNAIDPDGLFCPWCISGAIGAVLGVGVEVAANYGTIRNNIALGNYTAVAWQLGAAGAGGFVAGATGSGSIALATRAVSVVTGATVTAGSAAVASTLIGGASANVVGNAVGQGLKVASGLQDAYSVREGAFAALTGAASSYAPALISAIPGGSQALEQPLVSGVMDALTQSKGAGLDLLSKPLQEAPSIISDFVASPAYATPSNSSSSPNQGTGK